MFSLFNFPFSSQQQHFNTIAKNWNEIEFFLYWFSIFQFIFSSFFSSFLLPIPRIFDEYISFISFFFFFSHKKFLFYFLVSANQITWIPHNSFIYLFTHSPNSIIHHWSLLYFFMLYSNFWNICAEFASKLQSGDTDTLVRIV